MTLKWRQQAEVVIRREIRAGQDAKQEPKEIRKRVDAAYPFGERAYHPYKQWLKARRDLFIMHGLSTTAETRTCRITTAADFPGDHGRSAPRWADPMTLLRRIASIPIADIGGKHAQHVALILAARFREKDNRIVAPYHEVRAATGLSRSSVQRAFTALRRCGLLVEDTYGIFFDPLCKLLKLDCNPGRTIEWMPKGNRFVSLSATTPADYGFYINPTGDLVIVDAPP